MELEAQLPQLQKDFQSENEEVMQNLVKVVERYFKLLKNACAEVIKKADVILCTCTTSGSPHMREVLQECQIKQVMVDEAAQALEPEALVPASLVSQWVMKIFMTKICARLLTHERADVDRIF